RQAQAGSSAAAGAVRIETHEAFEYSRSFGRGNARTVVTDAENSCSVPAADFDNDKRIRVADRVVHQIANHPRHRGWVTRQTRWADVGVDSASRFASNTSGFDLGKFVEGHLFLAHHRALFIGAGQQK